MKILCTTDFSTASVNAINWIYALLTSRNGGDIEIVHCVDPIRRAEMFLSIDDMMYNKALEDMEQLRQKYSHPDNVKVATSVYKTATKTFIPKYAKEQKYDCIVTGSTGLTSLKEMTIGSVSDYISKHSEVPVLIIPNENTYNGIENVVIGLGMDALHDPYNLSFLRTFCLMFDPNIYFVQVLPKDKHVVSMDHRIEEYFIDLTYQFKVLQEDGQVNEILHSFCQEINADVLCLIHTKRSWLQRIFHASTTKEELFQLTVPLLIIPDMKTS